MSFMPEAKKTYTLEQLLTNGINHMKSEGVAPAGAVEVTEATMDGLLKVFGGDTIMPGAVNDLLGRSLVHMVGAIGTINRVVELMQVHNNDPLKVYYQLEQEGLLLASPKLYEKD